MPILAVLRVNRYYAFEKIVLDFADPINTNCSHKREVTIFKSHLWLFICMCIKAVHIDLVLDLSTETFFVFLHSNDSIFIEAITQMFIQIMTKTVIGTAMYLK